MPKIEVDPLSHPEHELVAEIAPRLDEYLEGRNTYQNPVTGEEVDVSKTAVTSSDYFPDERAIDELSSDHEARLIELEYDGYCPKELMQAALTGNLLTERNLPQYQSAMMRGLIQVTPDRELTEPLERWVRTWTAEESTHSDVLLDVGMYTGVLDRQSFDQANFMVQSGDLNIRPESLPELWAYLMPQEAATVVSHQNTGRVFGPKVRQIMVDTASNESTHCKLNTDLVSWALEFDPEHTVQVLWRQFRTFDMPGKEVMPDYDSYADHMAVAGLFDAAASREVMRRSVKQLDLENIPLEKDRSKDYREKILNHVDDDSRVNKRIDQGIESRRDDLVEKFENEGGHKPFILGRTVEHIPLRAA